MKHHNGISFGILFLAIFGLFSCVDESSKTLENDPYFDLKGFIQKKSLEVDGKEVSKTSKIQGEEKQLELVYSTEDWEEELKVFTDADINRVSLFQSYEKKSSEDWETYELREDTKGKVKYIKINYKNEQVSSIRIKIADENLFFSSSILAELYLDSTTNQIDHYSIESSQKIWFMDPNNMKIQGVIQP